MVQMKCVLLMLLIAVLLMPDTDAWGRRRRRRRWIRIRGRRIIRFIRRALPYVPYVLPHLGKRDIENHDLNKDGLIDQSEAEKLFDTRDAEELLSLADADGDAKVSLEEWQSSLENIMSLAERDVDDALEGSFEDADDE